MPKIARFDTAQIVHILNISKGNRQLILPLYADLFVNHLTRDHLFEKIRKLLKHNVHNIAIRNIIAPYIKTSIKEFYDWYVTYYLYEVLSYPEDTVKDMNLAVLTALTVGKTDDELFDEIARFVITSNVQGSASEKQLVRRVLTELSKQEDLPSYAPFTGRTDNPEYAPVYSKIQSGGRLFQSLMKMFH